MNAYTSQQVSIISVKVTRYQREPTDGSKDYKSNRGCHHGLTGSDILLVQPVKGIGTSLDFADGCPTEIETREEDDAQSVCPNALPVSVVSVYVSCLRYKATHKGALDAVEPEDLNERDDRCDSKEVDDDKGLVPALPEYLRD